MVNVNVNVNDEFFLLYFLALLSYSDIYSLPRNKLKKRLFMTPHRLGLDELHVFFQQGHKHQDVMRGLGGVCATCTKGAMCTKGQLDSNVVSCGVMIDFNSFGPWWRQDGSAIRPDS